MVVMADATLHHHHHRMLGPFRSLNLIVMLGWGLYCMVLILDMNLHLFGVCSWRGKGGWVYLVVLQRNTQTLISTNGWECVYWIGEMVACRPDVICDTIKPDPTHTLSTRYDHRPKFSFCCQTCLYWMRLVWQRDREMEVVGRERERDRNSSLSLQWVNGKSKLPWINRGKRIGERWDAPQ